MNGTEGPYFIMSETDTIQGSLIWPYLLRGGVLGLSFPVIATMVDLITRGDTVSFDHIVAVQSSQPIHWVVDTFPFVFALFWAIAGRQQTIVAKFNEELSEKVAERTVELLEANENLQKSMQERKRVADVVEHAKKVWERTFDFVPDAIAILVETNKCCRV